MLGNAPISRKGTLVTGSGCSMEVMRATGFLPRMTITSFPASTSRRIREKFVLA